MRTRTGNAAVTVALTSTVVLAFAALVIDVGWGRLVKQQLENEADAAAHAAVANLDGTSAGVTLARSTAKSVAHQNWVADAHPTLSDSDIVFGVYDSTADTFTTSSNAASINAVRVTARRNGLSLFFAPVAFGRASIDVGATTTMMAEPGGGAGEADCYLPFAIPSCELTQHGNLAALQYVEFKLQPAGIDNLGWALPNGTPSASTNSALLSNTCSQRNAKIGDPVGLQNGNTNSLTDVVSAINRSSTRWNTSLWGSQPTKMTNSSLTSVNYGKTLEGVIAVFDGGTSYCKSTASWNQNRTIVGFMWGAVFDVAASGATSSRNVRMRLDVTGTRGEGQGSGDGGPDWGVTSPVTPPRMVPS